MKYNSPLRYPGGKACLTVFLADILKSNNLMGCTYYEPFAGGAGAALGLLHREVVSKIFINDADPRVYTFWHAALYESWRFIDRIHTIPLTIEEWHRQNTICAHPKNYTTFDVGFAAFYMNRCNRSGVLIGSGPVGGYNQMGKWRMDVRFNRSELSNRILALGMMKNRIMISCMDAINFLKKRLPRGRGRSHVFVYFDPPYVGNGRRLYLNAYETKDHYVLADYLKAQNVLPWVMSYDDNCLILQLYTKFKISILPIKYTLQVKRSAKELFIAPNFLFLPRTCRVQGQLRSMQSA